MGAALSACGLWRKKPQKPHPQQSDQRGEGNSRLTSLTSYFASRVRRRPAKSKQTEPEDLQAFQQASDPELQSSRLQGALFSFRRGTPWKNSSKLLKPSPPISILRDNAAYRSLSRSEQAETEGHIIILNVFHAISSLERSYMAHFVQVAPSDDPYIRSLSQWTDANKRVMINTFEYISKLKADYMEKVCKGAREFPLPRSLSNPFENSMVKRKVLQLENMVASRDMEMRHLRDKIQKEAENHKRLIFQLSRDIEARDSELQNQGEQLKLSLQLGDSGRSRFNDVTMVRHFEEPLEIEQRMITQSHLVPPQTEITEIEGDD